MTHPFATAMRRATLSTRGQNLAEATRLIQEALGGRMPAASSEPAETMLALPSIRREPPFAIDPGAEIVEPAQTDAPKAGRFAGLMQGLREGPLSKGASNPLCGLTLPGMGGPSGPPPVPEGAQFTTRSFACPAGSRSYRLYVPASAAEKPLGLVVMLHGCKQNPDDFATGTAMNAVAEAHGLLVAYPHQTNAANASSCWNWFNPADQKRDAGEPAIIAGITRELMAEFGLERDAVFIAGLSAGGAMAAIMAETYPDLYAAVGIHSGLATGSASDVMSAFAAMRGQGGKTSSSRRPARSGPAVRTILFQGSADGTVHPSNADRILTAACGSAGGRQERARMTAGGRSVERTIVMDSDGAAAVESWRIEGAGHAWSGGDAKGSFTDATGPDASAEMVRFFLNEPA